MTVLCDKSELNHAFILLVIDDVVYILQSFTGIYSFTVADVMQPETFLETFTTLCTSDNKKSKKTAYIKLFKIKPGKARKSELSDEGYFSLEARLENVRQIEETLNDFTVEDVHMTYINNIRL